MIRLHGIAKSYHIGEQEIFAVRDVSFTIAAGEFIALVGASGSGKSTLMNILGCLDRASAGSFHLDGEDVSTLTEPALAAIRNRKIGFIFQSFHLLPRASALDNVAQPLLYRNIPRKERQRLALLALREVGLEDRQHHRPNELSGGQRQRVAIARALVGAPALLLADEPTGNLDSRTARDILALIEELHQAGQTVVMVTHDEELAARSDRVIRIHDGELVAARGAA